MGLGAFPASNPQWLGMLGMHGTYEANMAMHDCDLMINIGARFDDRITGRIDAFSPNSTKIHVDIDPVLDQQERRVDLPIVGDCGQVLEEMVRIWRARPTSRAPRRCAVVEADRQVARAQDRSASRTRTTIIKPQHAIQRLYEATKERRSTSPPKSASTRCGRRSISSSSSPTAG